MKIMCVLVAATASFVCVSSASAMVNVSSVDFGFTTAGPTASTITFDSDLPAGFALTGGLVRNLDDGQGAEPGIADGVKETTNYLAANPGDTATITSVQGYRNVSLYWGSIDAYNTVSLLDRAGGTIASFSGDRIDASADGNQFHAPTNRQVSFSTDGDTAAIYGVRFESSQPALEVDNVSFSNAVPETSIWAMMILGVGAVGAMMRRTAGSPGLARRAASPAA